MYYLYLHGFASGPQSRKAEYLSDRFRSFNLSLVVPDLNQGDFFHLTLSRQLEQAVALLRENEPVTVIGSSFGGLTAAWLAERYNQIERLVLLAPAFQFLHHWLSRLGEAQVAYWRETGSMPVYHYALGQEEALSYDFLRDVQRYPDDQLGRSLPTLILHGVQDDVVPVQTSRAYAANRPWVTVVELASDHTLGDALETIWQHLCHFCELPSS
jgi:hypothetical protein